MLTLHRLPMLSGTKKQFWTRGSVALVVASFAGIFIQAAPVHAYLKNPVNSVQRTLDTDTLLALEHVKNKEGGKNKNKNKNKSATTTASAKEPRGDLRHGCCGRYSRRGRPDHHGRRQGGG